MERIERFIPGYFKDCRKCAYRFRRILTSDFNCRVAQPEIDKDACKSFQPNLATSLRDMLTWARLAVFK